MDININGRDKLKSPEQLADEHWAWVVRWLEMVYKDAFIHGYKHGQEATSQNPPRNGVAKR